MLVTFNHVLAALWQTIILLQHSVLVTRTSIHWLKNKNINH